MTTHKAHAQWKGNLKDGSGQMDFESGYNGKYSAASRFENGQGTNPEEMIGAAHAGCYSMALANLLAKNGHEPQNIDTKAAVDLEKTDDGFRITKINLNTTASVPNMKADEFNKFAEQARTECTVSQALSVEIGLDAKLES